MMTIKTLKYVIALGMCAGAIPMFAGRPRHPRYR